MMYVLKFILFWLLPPGCVILGLAAVCACLARRWQKLAVGMLALMLYAASLTPVAVLLAHGLENQYTQPKTPATDVIAVLGGGAISGVDDVGGEGALSAIGMNRLVTGARLQRQLNLPIIVSGGKVFADSAVEADVSKRVLMELGIAGEAVYTDSAALNTRQNAENIAALCRQHGWYRVIVVTSALHMPRTMQSFAAGVSGDLQFVPYPCDYLFSQEQYLTPFSFAPQAYALDVTAMALKEHLALVYNEAMSYFFRE